MPGPFNATVYSASLHSTSHGENALLAKPTVVLFDELIEMILSWVHPSKVFRYRVLSRIFDARITSSLHFATLNLSRFMVPLGKGSAPTELTLSSNTINIFDKLWWNSWPKNYKAIYSTNFIHSIYKIEWCRVRTLDAPIPCQIGNLLNLTHLDLTDSNLTGTIPQDLMKLTKLRFLSLALNKLEGEIPSEIGNLVHLTMLYLETNEFTGTIPSSIGKLKKLQYLYLHSTNLTGPIPDTIGDLTQLERLTLRQNNHSGPLPLSLFNLRNLHLLYLYGNRLSGEIPKEIGNLRRLQNLKLGYNDLEGMVPRELLNLVPGLIECDLVGNPRLRCDFHVIPRVIHL
ncbi:UNVERIFIED_CONTAM: hypothetical protein HDU68_012595 [Siphonaria sp. JEL0065]|nr:hypothetical protein HDU68_012595 [Siphonaria sp. JEL0065]